MSIPFMVSLLLLIRYTASIHFPSHNYNNSSRNYTSPFLPSTPRIPLRILPIGDSLTLGYLSPDLTGYRKAFYDLASVRGDIDMIGSVSSGSDSMTDPFHEGHNAATIDQISGFADVALAARPNVVLLMAGTNNMFDDEAAGAAAGRLAELVEKVRFPLFSFQVSDVSSPTVKGLI